MTATILAKDRFNNPIQALQPSTVQNIVTGTGASVAVTNAFGGSTVVVRLLATYDCYVAFGTVPTATSSSMYLPSGRPEFFRVEEGAAWKVAALSVAAIGVLNIVEMT